MSDINKEYGKEIRKFIFDGFHSNQNFNLTNCSFIAYEKGLFVKEISGTESFYTAYKDMDFATLYEEETNYVKISLKNKDDKIEVENKKLSDLTEFYDFVLLQIEKYEYHDSLKKLEVNVEDISIIMDDKSFMNKAYFDTKTGEIIHVPNELDEDGVFDEEYISSLPKWEQEMVEDVKLIYEDDEERYIIIPQRTNFDAYDNMVEFAKRLDNMDIAEKLFDALDGKGAFSRFKNVISRNPKIEKEWYEYKEDIEKLEVKRWLYRIGIEPVER